MNRSHYLASMAAISVFSLVPVQDVGAAERFGIAAKAGTAGIGAELSATILPNTRIRGGFNYLSYSFDSTISDIDYEFEPEFNSFSLLLDVHPFEGSFFLSGGVYFNNTSVGVTGSVSPEDVPAAYGSYSFLADLTSISGDVEFNPVAPYAGIGWRSNNDGSGWGFAVELGVMFQGAPDVTNLRVNAPVNVNNIGEVKQFLAEQEREVEDELSWFQYYPVASFLLTYHF